MSTARKSMKKSRSYYPMDDDLEPFITPDVVIKEEIINYEPPTNDDPEVGVTKNNYL